MKRNLTFFSLLFATICVFGQPAAPTLIAPADGSTAVSLTPTFSWGTVTGATSYTFIYSANADLTAGSSTTKNGNTHTLGAGDLSTNSVYYWTVYATDGGGNGSTGDTFSFTTVGIPAPAPALAAPANNAINTADKPVLAWRSVATADSFELEVSADSNFVVVITNPTIASADTQYRVTTSLAYATKHFWRVRSINNGGVSAWSPVWKFTVKPVPPAKPILVSPVNHATGQKIRETILHWDSTQDVVKYRVLLSKNPSLTPAIYDTVVNVAIRSLLLRRGLLQADSTYFWSVNSIDSNNFINTGDTFTFTAGIAPPAAPVLASPASAAVNVGISPTLQWNATPNADSYIVHISALTNFTDTIRLGTTTTATSYTVPGKLASNVVHYWRVRAENAGGASDWSYYWNFTTLTSGLRELALENANLGNYPNPFISNTVISFDAVTGGKATLSVRDITGKEIATLLNGDIEAGNHTVTLDASGWNKGIYFYTLTIDLKSVTKTLVIQ